MGSWLRATGAAIVFWMLAGSSAAGTLQIDFALDQGSLAFGLIGFGGQTTTFTGSASIVLTGVDSLGAVTAATAGATFRGLDLQTDLTIGPLPRVEPVDRELIGPVRFSQLGVSTGTFDGATLQLPGGFAIQSVSSFMCRGPGCVVPLPQPMARLTFSAPGTPLDLQLLSIAAPGAARLNLNTLFGGVTGPILRLDLSGREVSRRFSVPETSPAGMLAIGLALLAMLPALAVRRRRAASAR